MKAFSPDSNLSALKVRLNSVQWTEKTIYYIPAPAELPALEEILAHLPSQSLLFLHQWEKNIDFPAFLKIKKGPWVWFTGSLVETELGSLLDRSLYRKGFFLPLTRSFRNFSGEYQRSFKALEENLFLFWKNKPTLIHFSALWHRNLFRNLERSPIMGCKVLRLESKPFVVAGAGESLEHSIPLLVRKRKCFYLMAVDSALPALLRAGLAPDFVVALESQFVNCWDLIGLGNEESCLMADLTSHPSTQEAFLHRGLYFMTQFTQSHLLNRIRKHFPHLPVLPPQGSVGLAAINLALELSDQEVHFTGLDFSYTWGKTHGRSTSAHVARFQGLDRLQSPYWAELCYQRPGTRTLGLDNKALLSNGVLQSYAQELKNLATQHPRLKDMRSTGLPLGVPRSPWLTAVQDSKESVISCADPVHTQVNQEKEKPGKEFALGRGGSGNTQIFFQNEYKLLDQFLVNLEKWNHGVPGAEKETLEALEECDYLYSGFPDADRMARNDRSFLSRCKWEAQKMQEELRAILEQGGWNGPGFSPNLS